MIHHGNALVVLKTMPAESVNCCVTSPPYFGLRDYGVAGQIGLESSPFEYVAVMVEVFEQVRRVLRDDGTLWLNLGDTYCNSDKWGGGGANTGLHTKAPDGTVESWKAVRRKWGNIPGLKQKDLIGVPWRVALALQEAGWWLRSDIIWHKPNPLPESVTDRPTKSHEYIFLLAKSEKYYFDQDAIREPHAPGSIERALRNRGGGKFTGQSAAEQSNLAKGNGYGTGDPSTVCSPGGRNTRTVWTVGTDPYTEAHFATFPPKLIEPCIIAGCPPGGVVLDPFAGAGTTWLVAKTHGRRFIGIELNPDYCKLAEKRVSQEVLNFA